MIPSHGNRQGWRSADVVPIKPHIGIPVTSYRTRPRFRLDWSRFIGLVVTPLALWAVILWGALG